MAFKHNSKLSKDEGKWSEVDKKKLPRIAFADMGEEDKKTSWKYPHHFCPDGDNEDEKGCYTTGTMYLHKRGLNAARAASKGARSGKKASKEVMDHLDQHADDLGMTKAKDTVKAIHLVHLVKNSLIGKSNLLKIKQYIETKGVITEELQTLVGSIVKNGNVQVATESIDNTLDLGDEILNDRLNELNDLLTILDFETEITQENIDNEFNKVINHLVVN